MSTHTEDQLAPLVAVKVQDRSAHNIFAAGYATAIATVASQSNASGCMGSLLTERYALAMAAGPDLLQAAQAAAAVLGRQKWATGSTDPEAVALFKLIAAIAKALGQ